MKFDEGDDTIENTLDKLGISGEFAANLLPAWEECKKHATSKDTDEKVTNILKVLASPSKYDIYKVAKGAFVNWSKLVEAREDAAQDILDGDCSSGGKKLGLIFKKIFDSDDSLMTFVFGSAYAKMKQAGQATVDIAYQAADTAK